MKKKLFLLLIITFGILLIPKNSFAKTLELNIPTNSINVDQQMFIMQFYSYREFYVIQSLLETSCDEPTSGYDDGFKDPPNGTSFSLMDSFSLKSHKANIIGIPDNYTCNMKNPDNDKELISFDSHSGVLRFQLLPNVNENDLVFPITDELRNYVSDEMPFMLDGYDSISLSFREIPLVENTDLVYDFTKYNDCYDMSFYNLQIFFGILQYFDQYGYDSNFPMLVPEIFGSNNLYESFSDKTGKELFRIYNDNNFGRIRIGEGVSYKDNFTYFLPNDLKSVFSNDGVHVNSISFRFGDEPKEETVVDKVKNIVTNPKTYSGLFIIFIVLACSISGIILNKKYNNN